MDSSLYCPQDCQKSHQDLLLGCSPTLAIVFEGTQLGNHGLEENIVEVVKTLPIQLVAAFQSSRSCLSNIDIGSTELLYSVGGDQGESRRLVQHFIR